MSRGSTLRRAAMRAAGIKIVKKVIKQRPVRKFLKSIFDAVAKSLDK